MNLPQISLRELFLLVVIAAMSCGWWVDHSRQQLTNHRLTDEAQIAEHKGFLSGFEEVENWLKSLAHKGSEDAQRVLSYWQMESKSWHRVLSESELKELGVERATPKGSLFSNEGP